MTRAAIAYTSTGNAGPTVDIQLLGSPLTDDDLKKLTISTSWCVIPTGPDKKPPEPLGEQLPEFQTPSWLSEDALFRTMRGGEE